MPGKRRRLRSQDLAAARLPRLQHWPNALRDLAARHETHLTRSRSGVEVLVGRCGRPFWRARALRDSAPWRRLSAPAEAGAASSLAERSVMATPPPGPDASTLSGGGRLKNCPSKERLPGPGGTVGAPALGPLRGCWAGIAARGHGGKGVGGLRAAWRRGRPAAPSPHPRRPCRPKLPGAPHAGAMATAAEVEVSPPTDANWESGGGDDEMKQTLPELESSPQNGGGLSIAEPGGGAGPEETAASEAAPSLCHEQLQDSPEAGAAALPKGPEEPERPIRRSFQIPRKSREKKGCASPLSQPLFLSPLHLFIRTSLSPSHTHPRHVNTHAAPAASPLTASAAQLLRLVREESGGITLPAPPLPVEVGSSYFEACP